MRPVKIKKEWFKICREGTVEVSKLRLKNMCSAANQPSEQRFPCTCGRNFRRRGDLTKYKRFCSSEG